MSSKNTVSIIKALIFFIIIIALFFVNFNKSGSSMIIKDPQINNNDYNNDNLANSNIIINIDHLVGTCPRERECSSPSCSLWSDINHDGLCDRG